jgi:hypothetical protein
MRVAERSVASNRAVGHDKQDVRPVQFLFVSKFAHTAILAVWSSGHPARGHAGREADASKGPSYAQTHGRR